MFHCLVIKVVCLATARLLYHIQPSLSRTFFKFFNLFRSFKTQRSRRDLNPRAAINDLLPFQGSPFGQLGYFSKLPYNNLFFLFDSSAVRKLCYYIALFLFCQALFSSFLFYFFTRFCLTSGESGIRTHAPLRTNGFQDRLVMTTSISLRIYFCAVCQRKKYSIIKFSPCQYRI